ncbi:MAG: hypothetical protein K9M56_04290 [Victivallales bacterium]|nr:hypothetical protein [Victivallales bacterium]
MDCELEKKNTVTSEQIDVLFNCSKKNYCKLGEKTLVICVTLPNGFEIVENASCVDPANYDEEIGRDICEQRIKNKLWELEGYKLQFSLKGN